MSGHFVFAPAPRPRAELRLFCLPYAGGGAAIFQRWPGWIDPRVEVVCVEPPGRGRSFRVPPCADLSTLVPVLCGQMLPWLDCPFALFGHSNGALIAFELARALQRLGYVPELFFASAKAAPALRHKEEIWHTLPDEQLLEQLRKLGGTPDEFFDNKDLQDLLLPTIRADFALSETYRYAPAAPLRTTPVLISARADETMDGSDRASWAKEFSHASLHHEVDGGHFFIDEAPAALLDILNGELAKCLRKPIAA